MAEQVCGDSVTALNTLYGASSDEGGVCGKTTLAQRAALDRLGAAARSLGRPPAEMSGEEALGELLAKIDYSGSAGHVVPLEVDRLALPRVGFTPVPMATLDARLDLNFSQRLIGAVLPADEGDARIQACGVRRPYLDQGTRKSRRKSARFRLY